MWQTLQFKTDQIKTFFHLECIEFMPQHFIVEVPGPFHNFLSLFCHILTDCSECSGTQPGLRSEGKLEKGLFTTMPLICDDLHTLAEHQD